MRSNAGDLRAAPEPPPGHLNDEPRELSGILLGLGGDFAVINGQILTTGQEVCGARIERIEEHQVVLREGDQTWTLTLQAPSNRPD